jgi:hypothetical protein
MSGGRFDYDQYKIGQIADTIEAILENQGKEKKQEYYDECNTYPEYSKGIQDRLRDAVKALRIAEIYAQRVDWFLSGDDGEENFIIRLCQDLEKFKDE